MVSTFRSFIQSFASYPLRGVLTILTIAIGVGALIITFGLSLEVSSALERSLSATGRRIVISNAELRSDGTIARQVPSVFASGTADLLERDYGELSHVTPVATARWQHATAGGTSYQVRRALAVGAGYADLMELDFVNGSFFGPDDVSAGRPVVILSETAARILFGGPQAAMSQQIHTTGQAAVQTRMGDNELRTTAPQTPFTVVGVFADVPDLAREAYGIGDFLIPYGVNLPRGVPGGIDPSAVLMGRLTGSSLTVAESRIRSILELEYGDHVSAAIWEGSPSGPRPLIEESRSAVSSFIVTVNALGLLILVASSIGIFSVMLVEVVNRMREIGLRRAIGATQAGIRRLFLAQALYLALAGAAAGVALAFVFYRAIGSALAPFFETSGLSAASLDLSRPGIVPIALAVGAATVIGALFGFFPAISASRIAIVEAIRDDAA